LPRLKAEIGDGSLAEPYAKADYDRFLAGVRLALRSSPEDIARLAGRLCTEDNPYADEALAQVVLAALSKCPPEARRRFFDFDPAAASEPDTQAIATVQRVAHDPVMRGRRFVENAFFRARDYAKRKLAG
jgi:hypothetical protein